MVAITIRSANAPTWRFEVLGPGAKRRRHGVLRWVRSPCGHGVVLAAPPASVGCRTGGARSGLASRDGTTVPGAWFATNLSGAPPCAPPWARRWSAPERGDGSVVVLTGEPGIGKTTIARDVADRARRAGVSVRWAACWPGGGTVAHGPWLTVLAGLGARRGAGARCARSAPTVDGTAAATSARASAYASVGAALERAAADRPFVVVLDDLHWADEGTVQLLAAVAGQVPALPVLIVAAYRDTEVAPGSPLTQLDVVGRPHGAARRSTRPAWRRCCPSRSGRERADTVAAEVGTGPAATRSSSSSSAGCWPPNRAGSTAASCPRGARDLLAGRLAALGTDRPVGPRCGARCSAARSRSLDLSALLEIPPDDVASALDRAATLRVVERSAGVGSWAFVHDLFREADPRCRPPTPSVADLHRRAAAALVAADAEPAVDRRTTCSRPTAAGRPRRPGGRPGPATARSARSRGRRPPAHYERAPCRARDGDRRRRVRADALVGLGRARLLVGDAQGAGRGLRGAGRGRPAAPDPPSSLARAALGFSADLSGFEVRLFDQRQIDLLEEAAEPSPARVSTVAAGDGPGPAVGRAVAERARATGGSQLAETAVALGRGRRRAGRARPLPGRPLRRASPSPDHVELATGRRDRDRRHRRARERRAARAPRPAAALRRAASSSATSARRRGGGGVRAAGRRRSATRSTPGTCRSGPGKRRSSTATSTRATSRSTRPDELGRAAGQHQRGDAGPGAVARPGLGQPATSPEPCDRMERLVRGEPRARRCTCRRPARIALSYSLAGRDARGQASSSTAAKRSAIDALPFDAEWLPNAYALLEAAVRNSALVRSRCSSDVLESVRRAGRLRGHRRRPPRARRPLAGARLLRCSAATTKPSTYARGAARDQRRAGGLLAADAMRTLAECLEGRGAPGDADEAATLHARRRRRVPGIRCASSDSWTQHGVRRPTADPAHRRGNELRRAGDVWHLTFGGTTTIVKHSKGMADLAVLLAAPDASST